MDSEELVMTALTIGQNLSARVEVVTPKVTKRIKHARYS